MLNAQALENKEETVQENYLELQTQIFFVNVKRIDVIIWEVEMEKGMKNQL